MYCIVFRWPDARIMARQTLVHIRRNLANRALVVTLLRAHHP